MDRCNFVLAAAVAATIAAIPQSSTAAPPKNLNLSAIGTAAASGTTTVSKSAALLKPSLGSTLGGSVTIHPTAPGPLPGQVFVLSSYGVVTARDGGHHSIDALTSAPTGGPNARFTVEQIPGYLLFKTSGGYYVSAAGGGGWTPDHPDSETMQTEETTPGSDALFNVHSLYGALSYFSIETYYNYYLTAENGVNGSPGNFRSDATSPTSSADGFAFYHCGDLGDGYDYAIYLPTQGELGAALGGGAVKNALGVYNPPTRFKFLRQSDGSYALQTSNGVNYVTAINGGGLAHGTATYDNLVTNRTEVQDWEKFRIVDQGDCTYTIQTVSGFYVGFAAPGNGNGSALTTDISDPAAGPSIDYSAYFMITPVWN
jgi:hypothetical protein